MVAKDRDESFLFLVSYACMWDFKGRIFVFLDLCAYRVNDTKATARKEIFLQKLLTRGSRDS